jgi:hypothetical protein
MKPHLYFKNPQEGLEAYRQRPGGFDDSAENSDNEVVDYTPMADEFSYSKTRFIENRTLRHEKRTIKVPVHFDLIEIEFQGCFDQPTYEQSYFNNFGLSLVHLSKFNRVGLFIISDIDLFESFFKQLDTFISNVRNNQEEEYDGKIRFIRSFKLYDSREMIRDINNYETLHLSLIYHSLLQDELIVPQKKALLEYLTRENIDFTNNENSIEIFRTSEDILHEILDNFDMVYATCSGSGAIIRPDAFNLPAREFGFTISNANLDDLPIIGIIDSGISNTTPLEPIIVNPGENFDLTQTGLFFDNADHGTGVAAFAALGNRLIPNYRGEVECDAKVLPIKILDSQSAPISQNKVINLIRRAHDEYGVKIFTLTIGYAQFPIADNSEFSSYAASLDELTNELDILIFISTTNNCNNINDNSEYPQKFLDTDSNIAPPADSLNNISVGAAADNYENGDYVRRSGFPEFPTIYSRKSHFNFSDENIFNNTNRNQHLIKPDILMPGGDYEQYFFLGGGFEDRGNAAITIFSSNLTDRTKKRIGTSYSAPLAANLAAKLIKLYPDLDMQTVKALIINSAKRPKLGDSFANFSDSFINRIIGQGIPNANDLLFSDNNQATLVLEDVIEPGYIKSYSLHIPQYLNDAGKNRALLTFTSTLCFKFKPKVNSQLLYCPIHIGYAICKNLQLVSENEEVQAINGSGSKDIRINTSGKWSQDFYVKNKVVSNVQKLNFNVSRTNILNENNNFKVAINSHFHKLLTEADREEYRHEIPFSLVINIRQNPKNGEVLNDLYDELEAVNSLEPIIEIGELEAEL